MGGQAGGSGQPRARGLCAPHDHGVDLGHEALVARAPRGQGRRGEAHAGGALEQAEPRGALLEHLGGSGELGVAGRVPALVRERLVELRAQERGAPAAVGDAGAVGALLAGQPAPDPLRGVGRALGVGALEDRAPAHAIGAFARLSRTR